MISKIKTRFAPSPTGHLHLGHLYAAKVACRFAESRGGEFLLRFEDIDFTRVKEECYQSIIENLNWARLRVSDVPINQSGRLEIYKEAFERLRAKGVLYPCFCTRKKVTIDIGNAPESQEANFYPGTCRNLKKDEVNKMSQMGAPHCWRLDFNKALALTGPIYFKDLLYGGVKVDSKVLGDVILWRKDVSVSYHIAVTVDDAWQEISHVTRGEDLLPSTHVHRLLQKLLNLPTPIYLHHPLVKERGGDKLSKRRKSLSLQEFIKRGAVARDLLDSLNLPIEFN